MTYDRIIGNVLFVNIIFIRNEFDLKLEAIDASCRIKLLFCLLIFDALSQILLSGELIISTFALIRKGIVIIKLISFLLNAKL
jgi:hypothetical protein